MTTLDTNSNEHPAPAIAAAEVTRRAFEQAARKAESRMLPVTLLKPNPYNPRKRIEPKALGELAESIARFGVLQPILARPITNAVAGEPQFEIIAGERRWRAVQKVADATKPGKGKSAPVAEIPALVREISDFEAMEMATVENLERVDLHPIEEAEAFQLLMHPPKGATGTPAKAYTAEDLAAKFGKSRSHIFGRLKLLDLGKEVRDAFFDGKIAPTIATLIARQPVDQQVKILKECQRGYGGEPFTFRQAAEHIQRNYMLELARAPFKITDATLVPTAGSCRECPKRTGSNPDLFDDVKGADVCTDASCFNAKRDAAEARTRAEAEAQGTKVVDKPKPNEYVRLDQHDYTLGNNHGKTVRQLLGKDADVQTVLVQTSDGLVPAVKRSEVVATLKAKGITASTGSGNDHMRQAEAKAKAGTAWRRLVAIDSLSHLASLKSIDEAAELKVLRLAAETMYERLSHEDTQRMHSLLGSKPIERLYDRKGINELRNALAKLDMRGLLSMFAAMSIAGDVHQSTYSGNEKAEGTRLRELAALCKVNVDKTRNAVLAEQRAAQRAKAAKAAKPKAAPAKKKPAAKKASKS
jgi:ParB/RepB/Spo0J family partition protein